MLTSSYMPCLPDTDRAAVVVIQYSVRAPAILTAFIRVLRPSGGTSAPARRSDNRTMRSLGIEGTSPS